MHLNGNCLWKSGLKTVEAKVIIPTWYVKTNETMAIKVPHVKIEKKTPL